MATAGAWSPLVHAAGLAPGPRRKSAAMAIIIDDIGFSRSRAHNFLSLNIPLTFSILPRITYTRELAETLHGAGHEIMLHQPMEPVDNSFNPGPGALYTAYRQPEIVAAIEKNISQIPNVIGVNNHMGSKFTADPDKMRQALDVVKSRQLFFVDSMTTNRSAGFPTASRLGITAVRRNIFLDNRLAVADILRQLDQLQGHALKTGKAVAIGHPFPETVAALRIFNRRRKKAGVKFVHISGIL
jgi:polysaccharide deacetylase 2 family uncharacterized protein YibQ